MIANPEELRHPWNSLQDPICNSKYPSAYLRLLAALDNGWYILQSDLIPSWDQNGFVFRIQIEQTLTGNYEELILTRSLALEELLEQYSLIKCD